MYIPCPDANHGATVYLLTYKTGQFLNVGVKTYSSTMLRIWNDIPVISMEKSHRFSLLSTSYSLKKPLVRPVVQSPLPGTQAMVVFAEQKHRLAPHGGGSGTH